MEGSDTVNFVSKIPAYESSVDKVNRKRYDIELKAELLTKASDRVKRYDSESSIYMKLVCHQIYYKI